MTMEEYRTNGGKEMRRNYFDRHRRLHPRDWKAIRDPVPRWAENYGYRAYNDPQCPWYTPRHTRLNRPRDERPDRFDCWFITLNFGSWRAREETRPSLKYSW